jgi:hypothetical protein
MRRVPSSCNDSIKRGKSASISSYGDFSAPRSRLAKLTMASRRMEFISAATHLRDTCTRELLFVRPAGTEPLAAYLSFTDDVYVCRP